jgi:WD40 repeat protein
MEEYSGGVSISPDGKLLVTQSNIWRRDQRGLLRVWDAAGETVLRTIDNPLGLSEEKRFESIYLEFARWLPGGRLLLGAPDGIRMWNLTAGKLERTFADPVDAQYGVHPLAVSADGSTLAGQSSRNNAVLVWHVADGKLRRTILERDVRRAALSPDGGLLALSDTSELRVYEAREAATGNTPLYRRAPDHNFDHALAFSPDGKILAVAGEATQLLAARDGRLKLSLYRFSQNRGEAPERAPQWLAITPQGFYDGSPGVEKFMSWRVGEQLFVAGKLRTQFHQPQEVRQVLEGD